jgi:hypothetical protein
MDLQNLQTAGLQTPLGSHRRHPSDLHELSAKRADQERSFMMDPDKALEDMIDAFSNMERPIDWNGARERALDLVEWISKGGFAPRPTSIQWIEILGAVIAFCDQNIEPRQPF